jgi:ribose 1,5-bisphosphate isomerase
MTSEAVDSAYKAIRSMEIRGAGRIARAATEALKEGAIRSQARSPAQLVAELTRYGLKLREARPTAVSLANAVNFVLVGANRGLGRRPKLEALRKLVVSLCDDFIANSMNAVNVIAEIGAKRIVSGDVVLTHCNSEAVTQILLAAKAQNKEFQVVVTETRPRYQGRLTATILAKNGVDVSLIPDSACRLYMHEVDRVIVGADAIASNGAVVNKIGTSTIAVVAHETRTRFYVAAETYKLSPRTLLGELVEIEERSPLEVVGERWMKENPGVKVKNPAFDVTPPEYIDLIITERGVFPPQGIVFLMKELYPEPIVTIVE